MSARQAFIVLVALATAAAVSPQPAPASTQAAMIELNIVACRDPAYCREFALLYDPWHVSVMTCMIGGQREIASWKARNPGWSVVRWTCRLRSETEASA
jgi:hypothetical protein